MFENSIEKYIITEMFPFLIPFSAYISSFPQLTIPSTSLRYISRIISRPTKVHGPLPALPRQIGKKLPLLKNGEFL